MSHSAPLCSPAHLLCSYLVHKLTGGAWGAVGGGILCDMYVWNEKGGVYPMEV